MSLCKNLTFWNLDARFVVTHRSIPILTCKNGHQHFSRKVLGLRHMQVVKGLSLQAFFNSVLQVG